MSFIAKVKGQLQMSVTEVSHLYRWWDECGLKSFFSGCPNTSTEKVKASGGCHGIGKECFVPAQSRFRTQLCRGI